MTSGTVITSPIKYCLFMIGAEPRSSHRIIPRIIWTILLVFSLFSEFWYCISYFKSQELPDLLDSLTVILGNIVMFVKVIVIWCNYRILSRILSIILDDWNKLSLNAPNKRFMVEKAVISMRVSHCLLVIYSTTYFLYAVSTVFMSGDTDEGLDGKQRKLLLKMMFPFDVMFTPVYEVVLLVQFVLQYCIVGVASMSMALIAALVLHVASQTDILCQEILSIPNSVTESKLPILKSAIAKHQRIIYLSENIKQLFLYISLVQFLSNILVICFLGFMLVVSLGTESGSSLMTKYLPYYATANAEAFVLCYTGEYLSTKSENIRRAVSDMDWYNLNQQDIHLILLMLLRTEKQLTLTAGKFVTLSVETFANMVKASASYISLLLAVY
ncbi:odorant receptor 13a-like [Nomia melanderi]|uniref:odorant receptor 13a-like n=1 Tax=Nomia melanderi TaxID=2448451 RepID=UPI0013046BB2|nr:odorant receptor 13a-like [Nomia melanderi]